jgi:hypothetical protein
LKSPDVAEIIARILKQVVEDARHTGRVDININCSQGYIRPPKVIITDSIGRVSIIEYNDQKGASSEKG